MGRLLAFAAILGLAANAAAAQPPAVGPTAAERMSKPGPEQRALQAETGDWDVVASLWPSPGAAPIVTKNVIARRTMIGSILQEIMQPAPGSKTPGFRRLDYLNYDRVEGRWKYVSMDTRFPVSIMPAWGSGPDDPRDIRLQFQPQAFVGFGKAVEGRFMVSDMRIRQRDADHLVKEQHVMMADGTGRSWLFTRYEYSRRK